VYARLSVCSGAWLKKKLFFHSWDKAKVSPTRFSEFLVSAAEKLGVLWRKQHTPHKAPKQKHGTKALITSPYSNYGVLFAEKLFLKKLI